MTPGGSSSRTSETTAQGSDPDAPVPELPPRETGGTLASGQGGGVGTRPDGGGGTDNQAWIGMFFGHWCPPPPPPVPPFLPPCVTFRPAAVPLRGPGQSPVLPFACCVGSLRSVGRCGRCSGWCRFRVRGAPSLVCWGCAGCWGCLTVFAFVFAPPPLFNKNFRAREKHGNFPMHQIASDHFRYTDVCVPVGPFGSGAGPSCGVSPVAALDRCGGAPAARRWPTPSGHPKSKPPPPSQTFGSPSPAIIDVDSAPPPPPPPGNAH